MIWDDNEDTEDFKRQSDKAISDLNRHIWTIVILFVLACFALWIFAIVDTARSGTADAVGALIFLPVYMAGAVAFAKSMTS